MKVLILQRVIPSYRVALFRLLSKEGTYKLKFIIGENSVKLKAKNSDDLSGINFVKLRSYVLIVLGRPFVFHAKLLQTIISEKPSVIICEAESHFLGYLTAVFYKIFLNKDVSLIKWCFYALPGVNKERSAFHGWIKSLTRKYFDSFLSYTTYGMNHLVHNGVDRGSVVVAVNVCDTDKFLSLNDSYKIRKDQAKEMIGHEGKFIVSYIGTIQEAKNPDVVVELAARLQDCNIVFMIVGSGPYMNQVQKKIESSSLKNCIITGLVDDGIEKFYRASDVIIMPGRGGIVISEAMCFGVPVVLFQADGVEHDLIKNGQTGFFTKSESVESFEEIIINLYLCPDKLEAVGQNARRLIIDKYNTKTMAVSILNSIKLVMGNKT